jgi:hypothetical protein
MVKAGGKLPLKDSIKGRNIYAAKAAKVDSLFI